ncbi:RNA polymerase sigma factor [Algibacter luteus]|uniref:RNA polymerase sigma-70 factor, ECF subfamily n=1 Tax=Algibacter luteus TaxID=1178825 RepID=A0A1M6F989_9FLAO|nr:RNA polymerase sigma-70 factor, ECF subfamily [Algibacter luteus]
MKKKSYRHIKSFLKVIPLHKNESALIKKAINNNREAQHVLFELHAPKMLSVCRYYIKDLQQAEEAMLNGFFKVFSNLKSFKSEGSFEGWIRRIMVRESISFLRQQKQVEFLSEEIEINNQLTDVIHTNLEVAEIQQIIDDLPEGYKMVFVLYAIEGYKHHEIANLLQITEGTSKSQLFKARKMLQQKIKKLNNLSYGTK